MPLDIARVDRRAAALGSPTPRMASLTWCTFAAVKVTINGKARKVTEPCTVADLVASLGFGNKQVVVEHNGDAVERARFPDVVLADGDRVEVVRPVQGG
jgi:sulfur carrier protein